MNIRKSSLAGLLLAGIISMFCSCSPTTGSAGPDNIILLSGNATGIKCQMPVSIGDVATDIGTKSIRFSEALAPGRITDMQVYEDYSFLQDDMGRIFCIEDDSIVNVLCLSADGADSTRILSCTYSPNRKTLYVTKENEAAILCYSVPSFQQNGTLDITGYDKKMQSETAGFMDDEPILNTVTELQECEVPADIFTVPEGIKVTERDFGGMGFGGGNPHHTKRESGTTSDSLFFT